MATGNGGRRKQTPDPVGARVARRRPVGLASLRGFEAAARHLSFTLAAQELHLTQSAISRQVAALEGEVGQKLFSRRTRSLELTGAGKRLSRSAQAALAGVDRAVDEIRGGQGAAPRIAVTTYPSFASLWLVPRLARFHRDNPGIEVRVDADSRRIDLEAEGFDIALRRCRHPEAPPGAVALFEEDATPALSPELLNRFGGRLHAPEDLMRLPLIELDDEVSNEMAGTWPRWFDDAGLGEERTDGAPIMVVTFVDQSMQAAARGQGVVLARRPFREDMVSEGLLVVPFPGIVSATGYGMYLVENRVTRERRPVAQFREWVLEESRRAPARQR